MKQKILISLTGAVLSSSLANNVALGSTIFSGNSQNAAVQSSRKLPEKVSASGVDPIFRAIAPALPSSITPKPQTLLSATPESNSFNSGVLPNENTGANGNNDNVANDNVATVVVNPELPRLPESFADTVNPVITPSVEVAVNPYIVPEVMPEVAAPAPTRTPFQRGEASWYGPGFDGNYSANGELFNRYAMTAAHPSLPFGTRVLVTNTDNGRSVVVRINDRGPFSGGRVIDLSQGAAASIGMIESGVADVQLDIIQP